ncbi:MAG: T9SS type A sorting domain-containing protein, partial [Mesonia sp.]
DYAVEIIENLTVESSVFNQLNFYPNPVENQLNLRAETPIENLKVYTILGQEVLRESPNTLETQLQTQNLPTGIYLIKVTLQGVQKSYKIIKK